MRRPPGAARERCGAADRTVRSDRNYNML